MKHQQAIFTQRLTNIKIGIEKAEAYLCGVSRMLTEDNVNIEAVKEEVGEIRDFLVWLQSQ